MDPKYHIFLHQSSDNVLWGNQVTFKEWIQ